MRVPGFATIKTDAKARIWLSWNTAYPTISVADLGSEELRFAGCYSGCDCRRIE